MASAAAALRGVDGGDEGCAPAHVQGVARPGHEPVVGVHDVGPPARQAGGGRDQVVVGPGHVGDELIVGHPGQLGAGPDHPHPVDDRVLGGVGMVQGQDDDLVPGPGQRSGQAVRVGRDAADDERRVLPRQHGHSHGGPT